jgi:hypothetical protein
MRRPADRFVVRFEVERSLRARLWKSATSEHAAGSENISEDGMCFATNLALSVRTVVEVLLKMPEEANGEPAVEWRSTGHVARGTSKGVWRRAARGCAI